jgi:DNA-directed RNA polymerase specialized sigma24 family protein
MASSAQPMPTVRAGRRVAAMLVSVQPVAAAHDEARPTAARSRASRAANWLEIERQRIGRFSAVCEACLDQQPVDDELAALCGSHLLQARDAARTAFDDWCASASQDRPDRDKLLAAYLIRAWDEPRQILAALLAAYVERARQGDQRALDQIGEAAGFPGELFLVLAAASSAGAPSEQVLQTTYTELHDRFAPILLGYARSKTYDDAAADDLCQGTWLEVWQKLLTYNPLRAPFDAFVKHWAGYQVKRHHARRRSASLDEVAGASVPPRGDRVAIAAETYDSLLRAAFQGESPPHQLIAFGFCKLLEWKPAELESERSDSPLRPLGMELQREYLDFLRLSGGPSSTVVEAFERLQRTMDLTFAEAVRDPKTRATHPALQARIVGETVLRDYYTGEPTRNITQWWDAVKRRAISELLREQRESAGTDERVAARLGAARSPGAGRTGQGERPNA